MCLWYLCWNCTACWCSLNLTTACRWFRSRIISVTTPHVRPSRRRECSVVETDRLDTSTRPMAPGWAGSLAGGRIMCPPGACMRTAWGAFGAAGRTAAPTAPELTACSRPLLDTMRITFRGAPGVPVVARPAARTGPIRLATPGPARPCRLATPRDAPACTSEFAKVPAEGPGTAAETPACCCCCCPARRTMTTFLSADEPSAGSGAGAATGEDLTPNRCFTLAGAAGALGAPSGAELDPG